MLATSRLLLSALAFPLLLSACSSAVNESAESATVFNPNITQVGQFQDMNLNRLQTHVFTPGTPVEEIRAHAEAVPFSPERLTVVYFYPEGARGASNEAFAQVRTIMNANDLVHDSPDYDRWHFAFMRPFIGEPVFVDCIRTPGDAICRQD